ncbi:ankyrin, partial [Thozetella sp. PMI_491]
TALHTASLRGSLGVLQALLEAGANLLSAARDNKTPLHLACEHGHASIVSLLCEHPSAQKVVDKPTKDGHVPLHFACASGKIASVTSLLQAGANI